MYGLDGQEELPEEGNAVIGEVGNGGRGGGLHGEEDEAAFVSWFILISAI
jgi:hypothetical protein